MSNGYTITRFLRPPLITTFKLIVVVAWVSLSLPTSAISDPTKPFSYKATHKAKPTYTLNSVLIGETRKVAVINGKAYAEGDRLQLGTLAKIAADHVVINGKGRHVLTLGVKVIRQ